MLEFLQKKLELEKMNRFKRINKIRKNLQNRKITIGSWMQIPNSSVAEIMGKAGYDWIAVDLEHGSITTSQLPDLFRAIELGGTLPIARIAQGTLKNCKSALDSGAGGIIIPMVESAEQLESCIEWSSWPPVGKRGVGFSRANLFGKYFEEYKQEAIQPLIIAQIEHIKSVENLNAILNVKGLDAIMIGPYDLSASMGITAQFENSEFVSILEKILFIAKKNNIPSGIHVVKPDKQELQKKIEEGFRFIAYSIDAVFLIENSAKPEVIK